jgi:aminoglycoside phosphotransferase (APT) family kinase protein
MSAEAGPDGRGGIDAELVRGQLVEQLPDYADLPIRPVPVDGWDNRTYRVGDTLAVRLPSHPRYAAAVEKEHRWLPVLAPHLPLPVPEPLALGRPSAAYPLPWSLRRWIDGEPASPERVADMVEFAHAAAGFLRALWAAPTEGGPAAGEHSFFRGAALSHYDGEARRCLTAADGVIDVQAATVVWEAALGARWTGRPRWFHGDVSAGNLLVRDGALVAVIDFGTCGVGDPACDLVLAWTFLEGPAREAFRAAVAQDDATWARARGWALWKALLGTVSADAELAAADRRLVAEVLTDHARVG